MVSKKTMRKFEKMSKQIGKASFKYAWVRFESSSCLTHFYIHTNSQTQVLDENAEERERGVTMEVASRDFETKKTLVTLLDSPGHKDFVRREREKITFINSQNESITSITHTHTHTHSHTHSHTHTNTNT